MRSSPYISYGGQDSLPAYSRHEREGLFSRLPSYEEVMRDRCRRQRSHLVIRRVAALPPVQSSFEGLLISPPDNQPSLDNGWASETQMDGTLAKNAVYFRAVLNHLRANWNTPLDGEMMDMVDQARRTHRILRRAVRQYFQDAHDQGLSQIEGQYRELVLRDPSFCKKVIGWAVYKRDRVVLGRYIKKARESRITLIDDLIYKIQLQRQAIYFRSAGLQQW
jgi:hypothetical protein